MLSRSRSRSRENCNGSTSLLASTAGPSVRVRYETVPDGCRSLTVCPAQECHRICLQLVLVRSCGCHDPLYPLTFAVRGRLQDVGRSCDLSFNCKIS